MDQNEDRPIGLYAYLSNQHLFGDYARLVSLGVYRRLPEFHKLKTSLERSQIDRLSIALTKRLDASACASIAAIATRLIEHELVLIRSPAEEAVLHEVQSIRTDAEDCLRRLRQLQLLFNDENHDIARPSFDLMTASRTPANPPNARIAATDLIKRKMDRPIPAWLELGPLIEACFSIEETFPRKRGPKADTFLILFFVTLANCATRLEVELKLPSKNTLAAGGSGLNRPFYAFVCEALLILHELGISVLSKKTVTDAEREAVLYRLKGFSDLRGAQLRQRLAAVRNRRVEGLTEFIQAAIKRATGSTPGRVRPKKKGAK